MLIRLELPVGGTRPYHQLKLFADRPVVPLAVTRLAERQAEKLEGTFAGTNDARAKMA